MKKVKLSTYIPLKYIKQSDKLQEIKCESIEYYTNVIYSENGYSVQSCQTIDKDRFVEINEYWDYDDLKEYRYIKEHLPKDGYIYSAPTIADCIDNAEELFGRMGIHYKMYVIIDMCLQNKSIEEISEYILDNITPTK